MTAVSGFTWVTWHERTGRLSGEECNDSYNRLGSLHYSSGGRLRVHRAGVDTASSGSQLDSASSENAAQTETWPAMVYCKTVAADIRNGETSQNMLWTMFVILLILWLMGMVTSYKLRRDITEADSLPFSQCLASL